MSKCKAQPTFDPPQDCNWPWCGCDPAADKVIEAIHENDMRIMPENLIRAVLHALRSYQYGNAAPDLAKGIADQIEALIAPHEDK